MPSIVVIEGIYYKKGKCYEIENGLEADLALSCCRLAVQLAVAMCGSFRGCADKMEAEALCWYIWRALFY